MTYQLILANKKLIIPGFDILVFQCSSLFSLAKTAKSKISQKLSGHQLNSFALTKKTYLLG